MPIYETGENHNFIIWIGYSINLSPHEGEVHVVDAHDDGSDGKSGSNRSYAGLNAEASWNPVWAL